MTLEEAIQDPSNGYRASKTFAEKAAWDFVKNEKSNFDLVTVRSSNRRNMISTLTRIVQSAPRDGSYCALSE